LVLAFMVMPALGNVELPRPALEETMLLHPYHPDITLRNTL